MSRILVINASPMVGGSVTRQLTAYASWKLVTEDQEADVSFRDIGTDPPAHLNDAMIRAFRAPPDALDADAAALVEASDALANEVAGADMIILGLPIYNFGSPSVLKAWFDQVVREDKTYRVVDGAPQPLHAGKTAIVVTATGAGLGPCANEDALEQVEPYLASTLKLLGAETVHFIHADSQACDADAARKGKNRAYRKLDRLIEKPTQRRLAA